MIDFDGLPLEEEEEEEEDDDEYDDEYDDEASDEDASAEEESSDDPEAETGKDDEWGFGEKKSRFSREVIVGFLAIAILCSVFGVVVFNNLQGGDDSVAEEESPEGELGEEGVGEGTDPFASGTDVRVASHTAPDGSAVSGPGDGSGETSGLFPESGTGSGMELADSLEPGTEGLGGQGEPAIEIGSNETSERLDPFGQPIGSTGSTAGIGEAGAARIGDSGTGEIFIGESGNGFSETSTGDTEFAGSEFTSTGEESTSPFGSEIQTGTGLASEGTTSLFEPEATAVDAGTAADTGEAISPFGPSEPTGRVDEFGRPVDEFGRPVESTPERSPIVEESTGAFSETGSINSGESGLGDPLSRPGEMTPASEELTSTPLTEGTVTPLIEETTTGLFPEESTEIGSVEERSTGLFDPTVESGTETGSAPGETGSTETPGFESTGTREGSFFPAETESSPGSLPGAFPGEATETLPASDLTASDPATGSSGLPTIRGQGDDPISAGSATSITGGYPVQAGDSYWTISRKVYGTARYFRVLAEYNSRTIPDPAKMRPGMTVQTPAESVLREMLVANSSASAGSAATARPAGSPPVTPQQGVFFDEKNQPLYRVGKDDTLTTIAADHLGRWARWRQIFEMNKDQLDNPNKLQIGMVLKLPSDATRSAMSRRDEQIR